MTLAVGMRVRWPTKAGMVQEGEIEEVVAPNAYPRNPHVPAGKARPEESYVIRVRYGGKRISWRWCWPLTAKFLATVEVVSEAA